jgi:hypothetical protein
MQMKQKITALLLLFFLAVSILEVSAQANWSMIVGADYDMYFDNREFVDNRFGESQTIFSSRLTPKVGVAWGEKNALIAGVELWSDFGNNNVMFAKKRPQIYYQFKSRNVSAYAGIFPREKMLGEFSEVIMSDSMRFFDNRVQGVMGQYHTERGFVEISADWCGKYSEYSREKFRIMSSGKYFFDNYHKRFYGGYNFMMFHFAGSKLIEHCVNDQLTINPYVGARFSAYFDFDVRLNYVQTFQRDRDNDEKYRTPKGGMLQFKMSKWGVYLDELLYVGENLQPYYRSFRSDRFPYGYGGELYAGESFFGTTEHIYSNAKIGYNRWFFNNTVGVNCYFAVIHDGTGWGNKQVVHVSVRLLKDNISMNNK